MDQMTDDPAPLTPKFLLGRVVATPAAIDFCNLPVHGDQMPRLLERHASGDWGDVDQSDARANDAALSADDPQRVLSAYTDCFGRKVWIITEWDRSVTTVLLPSEY